MVINEMNIQKYDKNRHQEFIKKCITSPDYKFVNIYEDKLNYSDIYIFSKKDSSIGFFMPNISDTTEIIISKPIIYVLEKRTMNSALMIFALLEFIFNHLNAEVIHIPIYADNKRMINLIENNNIRFMGEQKSYDGINILYYILTQKDYLKIYSSGDFNYG